MKSIHIRICIFFICCSVSIITAWLAGYDFDNRGADVAFWFISTVILAGLFSAFPDVGGNHE